jgi:phosphoribosylanthranilate isomerase
MFKIKICGITTPDDALLAAEAGADAIGLNFYEKSPRCISTERAVDVFQALEARSWPGTIVGVFVNNDFEQISDRCARPGLTSLQLHGDEPPKLLAELKQFVEGLRTPIDLPWYIHLITGRIPPTQVLIVRALPSSDANLNQARQYLQECQQQGGLPHAVLLDAHSPGSYGGTGKVVDWHIVREQRDKLLGLPLILAGGLTPENVAEAIATARPDAVDVASGVESAPGKKDPAKVRDFLAAAKEAFATLARSASEG